MSNTNKLLNIILSTDGLIGAYPLQYDGLDASGNGNDLTLSDGSLNGISTPVFDRIISGDKFSDVGFNPIDGAKFSINMPPNLESVELMGIFDPTLSSWRGMIGLNIPLDGQTSNYRRHLVLNTTGELSLSDTLTGFSGDVFEVHHYVLQKEGSKNVVFVDGVRTHESEGLGLGFFNIQEDLNLTFGYYAASDSVQRNGGRVHHAATYSRPLTQDEISLRVDYNKNEFIDVLSVTAMNHKFSNEQTREQADERPDKVFTSPSSFLNNVTSYRNSFTKSTPFDSNGKLMDFGYIESTVLISGEVAAGKVVLCFNQSGSLLIGSTKSDKFGLYRFDYLPISEKYMIVSQYGEVDSKTPPDYNAVATDWQTPISYKGKS